jgi:hypothetical protein
MSTTTTNPTFKRINLRLPAVEFNAIQEQARKNDRRLADEMRRILRAGIDTNQKSSARNARG